MKEWEKVADEFHRLLEKEDVGNLDYCDHQGDRVVLDGWFTLPQLETIVEIWKKSK